MAKASLLNTTKWTGGTYARVSGVHGDTDRGFPTPPGITWHDLWVLDLDSMTFYDDVQEVNTIEGWCVRVSFDHGVVKTRRYGRYELRVRIAGVD